MLTNYDLLRAKMVVYLKCANLKESQILECKESIAHKEKSQKDDNPAIQELYQE